MLVTAYEIARYTGYSVGRIKGLQLEYRLFVKDKVNRKNLRITEADCKAAINQYNQLKLKRAHLRKRLTLKRARKRRQQLNYTRKLKRDIKRARWLVLEHQALNYKLSIKHDKVLSYKLLKLNKLMLSLIKKRKRFALLFNNLSKGIAINKTSLWGLSDLEPLPTAVGDGGDVIIK